MEGLAPSPLALVPLLAALLTTGCAMSEDALHRLSRQIDERNQQRSRQATEALRARGYSPQDEPTLQATLSEETRQHCLRTLHHGTGNDAPPPPAQARLQVAPAPRGEQPAPTPVEFSASVDEACEFFRTRTQDLAVTPDHGRPRRLHRVPNGMFLAYAPTGALVLVRPVSRIVEQHSVLVKRTCDHMPSPERDPLEQPRPTQVVLAESPPPIVDMIVEQEELTVRCTENTY